MEDPSSAVDFLKAVGLLKRLQRTGWVNSKVRAPRLDWVSDLVTDDRVHSTKHGDASLESVSVDDLYSGFREYSQCLQRLVNSPAESML